MATEIEAKFKVQSHDPIREALTSCGASRRKAGTESGTGTRAGTVLERNHILDLPDSRLRLRRSALRVRGVEGPDGKPCAAWLTFKGPPQDSSLKRREELEVEVADADATLAILRAAGFGEVLIYEKRRETWTLDACLVELDELPVLGLFVEIEGPNETTIAKVAQRLNLENIPHQTDGYVTQLVRYCDQQNLSPRVIRFAP